MSKELKFLAAQVANRRLDRRAFMGRAGALGVTTAVASTMLSDTVLAMGPKKGGRIRVGVEGGSTTDSLDPALSTNSTMNQITRLWGELMVDLGAEGEIEYRLAETVEASPDARIWTFRIRKGVTFSNGQPVTADDALATLERHAGEESKSGALGLLKDIKSMRSEGGSLIVELNNPNADFPYLMMDYHLVVQPNGGKDDPTAAVGAGPYIVKEHEAGVRTYVEKNPNYWDDGIGHAESIEVIILNDGTARTSALQSGQVDMIHRVDPKVAALVDRAPGVEVKTTSGAGHYVFIMHCNTAPFDNKDLRLALKYAMNREEMVEKILHGYGSVGNDTPINASYPLFSDDIEQRVYDPDKAAHHFKRSGHSGPVLLRTSDNSFPGAPDAAQLFQQSAAAAGIEIEIKREPNDGYWSEVWNAQPFCTSYWGGRPVQDQMFSTAYLSTADWNDTRFFNDRFDELLVAARGELDTAKRKTMYREMSVIVREEGGLICPMFNDFVDAVSDRVAGWGPSKGFGLMHFRAPLKMWATS